MTSTEDKPFWCHAGEVAEFGFVQRMLEAGISVMLNPAKKENKFTHDLFITLPSDLKTIRTRFNTAGRYGFDPRSAITLNAKDVQRYEELYPNIIIIFDVDFGDYQRLCYATLRQIKQAIKGGYAKSHTYLNRINDQSGNAKSSWVLDAEWFEVIK